MTDKKSSCSAAPVPLIYNILIRPVISMLFWIGCGSQEWIFQYIITIVSRLIAFCDLSPAVFCPTCFVGKTGETLCTMLMTDSILGSVFFHAGYDLLVILPLLVAQ